MHTLGAVVEGGFISGETTANGEGGSFYEEWENEDSSFLTPLLDPLPVETKFAKTKFARRHLDGTKFARRHLDAG